MQVSKPTSKTEPQASNVKVKAKGRPSWRPATVLKVPFKEPGFRYRWRHGDPANLQRAVEEGWEFVQKPTGVQKQPIENINSSDVEEGRIKTSITEYRGLVLMRAREELMQERDEYYAERTDAQVVTPNTYKRHVQGMFAKESLPSNALYDPGID